MRRYWSALTLDVAPCGGRRSPDQAKDGVDYTTYSVSRLRCVIGNNKALGEHRAWYNGVVQHVESRRGDNAVCSLYAGLNLENYFDARPRPTDNAVFFEPRANPLTFKRLGDHSTELYQAPTPF